MSTGLVRVVIKVLIAETWAHVLLSSGYSLHTANIISLWKLTIFVWFDHFDCRWFGFSSKNFRTKGVGLVLD